MSSELEPLRARGSAGSSRGRWLGLDHGVLRRSIRASVLVGTLLTALNHGDQMVAGLFAAELWWKIPLTFLVPFLVATYGALGNGRAKRG